jgi:hypothetical protein
MARSNAYRLQRPGGRERIEGGRTCDAGDESARDHGRRDRRLGPSWRWSHRFCWLPAAPRVREPRRPVQLVARRARRPVLRPRTRHLDDRVTEAARGVAAFSEGEQKRPKEPPVPSVSWPPIQVPASWFGSDPGPLRATLRYGDWSEAPRWLSTSFVIDRRTSGVRPRRVHRDPITIVDDPGTRRESDAHDGAGVGEIEAIERGLIPAVGAVAAYAFLMLMGALDRLAKGG